MGANLRSRSVVVITLGLHPRGPQFEPGRDHILDSAQCLSNVLFPDLHVPVHSFSMIFPEIYAACIRRTVIAMTKNHLMQSTSLWVTTMPSVEMKINTKAN